MNAERYRFRPLLAPALTAHEARALLDLMEKRGRGFYEVEIGSGYAKTLVLVEEDIVELMGHKLAKEDLELMAYKDERAAYVVLEKGIFKVEIRTRMSYYKLVAPYAGKAPTLEINGIHMHRIVDVDPWTDSLMKVRLARVRPGDQVLDVCTGLGYTAIISRLFGADYVLTLEKDENVLKIAEANPWSRRLADPQVDTILCDATLYLPNLESGSFDVVIHDPPRFSRTTGHLYSLEFYRELYRVLRRGGRLFHYTGAPGARYRRLNVPGGVASRLRKAGFDVRIVRGAGGVVGFKY